jgi:dienelactone hydrolase
VRADERVQAYWVAPVGAGPFLGVVFVHPAPGDRTTFLEEAVLLGKQGLAALVVEAPWAQGEVFGPKLAEPEVAREAFTRVVKELRRAIDPVHYVARAAPAALFFQFGRQDDFTQEQFERVAEAASEPKLVKWYDTDHYFQIAEAQKDRLDWLQTRLRK